MTPRITSIAAVVTEEGQTVHKPGSNALLFEILHGPHKGKRGADCELIDLVGRIRWDQKTVITYDTGRRCTLADFDN